MRRLPLLGRWPIARQIQRGDVTGLGDSASSPRTDALRPRIETADRILSASVAGSGLSVLDSLLHPRRAPRPTIAGITGALAGTMLSTYTGVLIGNAAVPLWNHTRVQLPLWFAALSAASLGSVLEITGNRSRGVRVYSTAAKPAVIVTARAVTRAANHERVGAPLRHGRSGTLMRCASWLGAASIAATISPWGGRRRQLIAGVLGTAAALAARHAIVQAGRASAADPRATFGPQRRAMADKP